MAQDGSRRFNWARLPLIATVADLPLNLRSRRGYLASDTRLCLATGSPLTGRKVPCQRTVPKLYQGSGETTGNNQEYQEAIGAGQSVEGKWLTTQMQVAEWDRDSASGLPPILHRLSIPDPQVPDRQVLGGLFRR